LFGIFGACTLKTEAEADHRISERGKPTPNRKTDNSVRVVSGRFGVFGKKMPSPMRKSLPKAIARFVRPLITTRDKWISDL